jgi:hypothetical protein
VSLSRWDPSVACGSLRMTGVTFQTLLTLSFRPQWRNLATLVAFTPTSFLNAVKKYVGVHSSPLFTTSLPLPAAKISRLRYTSLEMTRNRQECDVLIRLLPQTPSPQTWGEGKAGSQPCHSSRGILRFRYATLRMTKGRNGDTEGVPYSFGRTLPRG